MILVDRAMLHHDIVARASDPLVRRLYSPSLRAYPFDCIVSRTCFLVSQGQSGFVTCVDVVCDLRYTGSGRVVRGVNARKLRPLHPLRPGVYAVHCGWLARVEDAQPNVIVRFDDGAEVCVFESGPEDLLPLVGGQTDSESSYIPGMRVRVSTSALRTGSLLDSGSMLNGHFDTGASHLDGVVVSMVQGRTRLRFLACAEENATQPPHVVQESDWNIVHLEPLRSFMHSWWRLGDYGIYEPDGDAAPTVESSYGCLIRDEREHCVEIVHTPVPFANEIRK